MRMMLLGNDSLENCMKQLVTLMIFMVVLDHYSSIEKRKPCVCTYHLKQSLKTRFKNVEVHKLFHDRAYTYHLLEFIVIFDQLQVISLRATTYLMDANVDQWTHSYFTKTGAIL